MKVDGGLGGEGISPEWSEPEVSEMIVGVIRTKDVFFHPVTIIQMKGWLGFLAVLRQAMSYKSYRFINLVGNSRGATRRPQ